VSDRSTRKTPAEPGTRRAAPASRRREIGGRSSAPAGLVLVTVLVALGFGTMLNASALLETAERHPLGSTTRKVAVGVMDPIAAVSHALLLDRPREVVEWAAGRDTAGGSDAAATGTTVADAAPSTTVPSATTTVPSPTTTSATEPTVPTTVPSDPVPTPDDPLKVWIVGDSLVEMFGPELRNDLAATGVVVSEIDFRFSSSLVRRDYFDWPAHVAGRITEVRPDVIVAQFGGNDSQDMNYDGEYRTLDTDAWVEGYRGLVGDLMDVFVEGGTEQVYWVGLPIMRSEQFTQRALVYNGAYRAEADERDTVRYIDVFDLFKDESGGYSTYLPNEDGEMVIMRSADGVHYALDGGRNLARYVAAIIADDRGFADLR
jgi:hypothetical protein